MAPAKGIKDAVLWQFDTDEDGALAVGTKTSPWIETSGFSEVIIQGVVTNSTGTTTVFIDQSHRPSGAQELASADQFASLAAGAKVNVSMRYVRVRVVQATATATAASLALKASD